MKCERCPSENDVIRMLFGKGVFISGSMDMHYLCADCRKEIADFIGQKKRKEIKLLGFISVYADIKIEPVTRAIDSFKEINIVANFDEHFSVGKVIVECLDFDEETRLFYVAEKNDGGFYRDGVWVDCNE